MFRAYSKDLDAPARRRAGRLTWSDFSARRLARFALSAAILCTASFASGAWLVTRMVPQDLPNDKALRTILEQPMILIDRNRPQPVIDCVCFRPVKFADLPHHLILALVVAEDHRFRVHDGIDWISLARAVVANLTAGEVIQGGSTLSQQLAKSIVGSDRTLFRKLREAIVAKRIEAAFSKAEILERYLNRAYFGRRAWGVESAARRYFRKHARDLSLYEAAALVGMVQAPSRYADDPDRQARRVLDLMLLAGAITPDDRATALRTRSHFGNVPPDAVDTRFYRSWALREIDRLLPVPARGVERVVVALDLQHQEIANRVVAMAARDGRVPAGHEAALVGIDRAGRVTSLVGGLDFQASQYDRATMARRQPGSTVKPFVYLRALESGWNARSPLEDAPITINGWRPENHDGRFLGRIELTRALVLSRNAATVWLGRELGPETVGSSMERFGLPVGDDPTIVLGTAETRLIDLTSAYATLAAEGRQVHPVGILAVLGRTGAIRYRVLNGIGAAIASASAVRVINDALRQVASRVAPGQGWTGKSGTTQGHRDAWFVGSAQSLTLGIWIGREFGTAPTQIWGAKQSGRIWAEALGTLDLLN